MYEIRLPVFDEHILTTHEYTSFPQAVCDCQVIHQFLGTQYDLDVLDKETGEIIYRTDASNYYQLQYQEQNVYLDVGLPVPQHIYKVFAKYTRDLLDRPVRVVDVTNGQIVYEIGVDIDN